MKKILFLGAAPHQVPAIRHAKRAGCIVFTCDNIPTNPGHALADASFSVSVIDRMAVLGLARRLEVDAVIGYASEPCALAAAWVADEMGLHGCGYAAASVMAEKHRFRELLRDAGIQDHPFAMFHESERSEAHAWALQAGCEVVLKPVDASGSKGVTVRPQPTELDAAFDFALANSPTRRVIMEAFVPHIGQQRGGDGWFEDGRLAFACIDDSFAMSGMKNPDILAHTFPSQHTADTLSQVRALLDRSGRAAGLHCGPINFDVLIRPDGTPFLIEMTARNGGILLPDAIALQTGVDLIAAAVEVALDPEFRLPMPAVTAERFHATYAVHSLKAGRLMGWNVAGELEPHVVQTVPLVSPGGAVVPFAKANDAVAYLILRFDSADQMLNMMPTLPNLCRVEVDPSP